MSSKTLRCLAVVLKLSCISLAVPRGVNGCTGLVLTSSISGRNACPSEEVTFTCASQRPALFWGNEAFGEKTMHYTSAPFTLRDEFRAEIVSYNQSCLVSSLSFQATASRNGTTVTCTNRNRNSSQSLSLHIVSNITLEHLTVVPVSLSSVLLEWKVTPSDGHHCIRNYNIQVSGPNGSQWEEQILGANNSYYFTELELIPFQEYTYCVTANLSYDQIDLKLTVNFTELQGCSDLWTTFITTCPCTVDLLLDYIMCSQLYIEPHLPTNLSAVIQCYRGYEIRIDWQPPLPKLHSLPVTGYLLQYHVYDNTTTIELPVNTSYTLDGVPSDAVYNITVSALSEVGQSKNNPSVQFAVPSIVCTVTTTENTDSSVDSSISVTISVLMSGMVAVSCVVLFACFCYHVIIRRRRTLKKEDQVSKQVATVFQTKEKSPEYEEICLQNHSQFHIVKNIAYASNDWH